MARTDRLMRLMDTLRRLPAPVTAARLACETGVSPRQLYRDIATLRAGGALIDGEAGLGYTLTEDPALPPQSFSRLEIESLVLAVAALRSVADTDMARAGEAALARIIATLPDSQARHALHSTLRLFRTQNTRTAPVIDMDLLRNAMWEERALSITYLDLKDQRSIRDVWPLGMSYSETSMMLLVWCLLRKDFRTFHISRIEHAEMTGNSFRPRRVALLRDYIAQRRALPGGHPPAR